MKEDGEKKKGQRALAGKRGTEKKGTARESEPYVVLGSP